MIMNVWVKEYVDQRIYSISNNQLAGHLKIKYQGENQ